MYKKIKTLMMKKLQECKVGIDFVIILDNEILGTTAHLNGARIGAKALLIRQAEGVARINRMTKAPEALVWIGNDRDLQIIPFKENMLEQFQNKQGRGK